MIFKKSLYPSCICMILLTIPLVLSRSDFQDDMYRSTSGYTDFWFENARPLSVWLYRFLHQGFITPDTSPLNFVLAMFIILSSGVLIAQKISPEHGSVPRLCIPILFMSSPFLTSILSYKYDSLTASTALLIAAIVPIYNYKKKFLDIIIGTILLVIMFCLYQPALSLMVGLMGVSLISGNRNEKTSHKIEHLTLSSIKIIISFILYKHFIADNFLNDYYKQSGTLIELNQNFAQSISFNIVNYSKNLSLFLLNPYIFTPTLLGLILILLDSFIFRTHRSALLIISFILVAIGALGCNIILRSPSFQGREMLGMPALLILIVLLLCQSKFKRFAPPVAVAITLGVFLTNLVLSYTFLNYKDAIKDRDSLVVAAVNSSIENYGVGNINKIRIDESSFFNTKKMNVIQIAHPIISRMIYDKGPSSTWYFRALINEESGIDFPISKLDTNGYNPDFRTCFTSSSLTDASLNIRFEKNCLVHNNI